MRESERRVEPEKGVADGERLLLALDGLCAALGSDGSLNPTTRAWAVEVRTLLGQRSGTSPRAGRMKARSVASRLAGAPGV